MASGFLVNTSGFECWLVVLVFLALVILLAILAYVMRRLKGERKSAHYCRYCGHLNPVVSDCCGGKVREDFLKGTCLVCNNECRIICAKCRRPIH